MELLNALGINFKLLIIQATGFLMLLFILKKFLFGRIMKIIKARTDEVKETYAKTEKDRDDAEKLKMSYQKRLTESNAEADTKIQDAVKEAKFISDDIINKSNDKANEIKSKAQADIEYERKQALESVREQVVNLTILASAKLIEQSINEDTAKKLVDEVVNEVGGLS
ncbi:MAG: F0F1 ATP synthase subunit B [Candidatus Anammoxibacter sp.]